MRVAVTALLGTVLACLAGVAWRRFRVWQLAARRRLAQSEFAERRAEWTALFLPAVAALGKPRGLRWESCEFHDGQRFAVDRVTGQHFALTGVTIRFSAVAGGDMEGVAAVSNLRCATAVFEYRHGAWTTDGRTIFNLEPDEALVHFQESLEPI